jgi:hypothetical protein
MGYCAGFSHLKDADTMIKAGIKVFAMKPLTNKEIARPGSESAG